MTGAQVVALLHDEFETSAMLGGTPSPQRLKRLAGLRRIPHRRVGRFARWSDADIAQMVAENFCDPRNYGRKPKRNRR